MVKIGTVDLSDTDVRVLEHLYTYGRVPSAKIAHKLGERAAVNALRTRLGVLKRIGLVDTLSGRGWALTDAARRDTPWRP